ncbi:MAG TPA: RpoL/Rpb11 RNA polymerase subunit family protein [Nitrososphaeraceae archaeon]|jgi:DNA-directed RNA polymerase subunit L
MHAELANIKDNELELKLQDEDISIMYIIQHELLTEKNVEFAGVILKHPLTREYIIRIITRKKDPFEIIEEATSKASEVIKDITGMLKPALKR